MVPRRTGDDVRAAAQGDRAAFGRLYHRYARAVFLDLVARLRTREDAEDALQGAFLAAWRALPRLTNPERFLPWLFRIARNRARDLSRKRTPRLLGEPEDLVAPGPQGTSGAFDDPDCERLRTLVAELKPDTRAVVLLRAVEGWSAEEVAAARGWSAATVRRRYARALQHLRAGLGRSGSHGRRSADRDDRRARV